MEKRDSEQTSRVTQTSAIFINGLRFYDYCNKKGCNISGDSFFDYLIPQKIITIVQN